MFMNIRNDPRIKQYSERRQTPQLDEDYKRLYRFTKPHVEFLANEFLQENYETRGGALSSVQRMEVTLRYLADPGFQRSVAYQSGISQSTVSKTVSKTLAEIVSKMDNWIQFPQSANLIREAKEDWFNKLGFPSCIGAIDCTHVRIDKPTGRFGDEFVNRKNFPSLNVQATCNCNYVFTSVDCGWPGSVHDNRIFKNSDIYRIMLPNTFNTFILGDAGYGLTPFIMTPFKNPDGNIQRFYNKFHAKNRVIIEQSFGQLKRRFPILRYGIRLKMENMCACITACFILHNVAKHINDLDFDEEETFDDNIYYDVPREENAGQLRIQGQARRNAIAQVIYDLYNN